MAISLNKKVSVIVPNYNYAKYIRKRIKTILSQTYPIYELIILDDASTDESAEIIKNIVLDIKLKNPEMKIQYVGNKKNTGKAIAQWKKGIEMATGDYIWIAEADDLSKKTFLEEAMKGFDDPKVVISYTESMAISKIGVPIALDMRWSRDKEKSGHFEKSYTNDGRKEIEEIMAIRCTIPNVSAVVFKNNKKVLRYLDEAMKFVQVGDWYFYVKMMEDGKVCYNHRSLNKYRIHMGSKTRKSNKEGVHYGEVIKMHEYFRKEYGLTSKMEDAMVREEERIKIRHGIIE